jgi:hypothetical protein
MMKQCPTCNVDLLLCYAPYSLMQCLEIWRCVRCAYEEKGDLCDGEVHVEPSFTVTIKWQTDELTIEMIKVLRSMDYTLKNLSATKAMSLLKQKHHWSIEALSHSKMSALKSRCQELNLDFEIT